MKKAEIREVENFAQGRIARKRTAKIPTASSGSGHFVFVCLKASSSLPLLPSRGGCSKTPCLESRQPYKPLWPQDRGENDAVWFLRLGHKRPRGCPGSLGILASSRGSLLGLPLSEPSRHTVRCPSHMERPCVGPLVNSPAAPSHGVIPAQTPDMWGKKPPDDSSPQPPKSPQTSWGSTHHGLETSHPHCALSEFLTPEAVSIIK